MRRSVGTSALLAVATVVTANAAPAQSAAFMPTGACASAVALDSGIAHPDTARSLERDIARRAPATDQHAAVVLFAEASAREVRFAAQPRIVVHLCGAVTDSVHVIERRNLPERVQPGVTYRDVYIAVEIIGHLDAECLARRIGVAPDATGAAPASADCASLGIRDTSATR